MSDSKTIYFCLVVVSAGLLVAGCADSSSACAGDTDCEQNEVCVSSGGVFFGNGRCVLRDLVSTPDDVGGSDGGTMICSGPGDDGRPKPDVSTETCQPTNDGVERCDGVDNDCDGRIDECVEPKSCDLQQGVCAGASTVECSNDSYEQCGEQQYGEYYTQRDDEGWRCDGRDNDCDGTTDEWCCESGPGAGEQAPFSVSDIGPTRGPGKSQTAYSGFVQPAVVGALDGAPRGAAYFVARKTSAQEVTVEHRSVFGDVRGEPTQLVFRGVSEAGEIIGLTVVKLEQEYEVIVSTARVETETSGDGSQTEVLGTTAIFSRSVSADGQSFGSVTLATPSGAHTRLVGESLEGRVVFASLSYNSLTTEFGDITIWTYRADNRRGGPRRIGLPSVVDSRVRSSGSDRPQDLPSRPVSTVHPEAGIGLGWSSFDGSGGRTINFLSVDSEGRVTGSAAFERGMNEGSPPIASGFHGVVWRGERELLMTHDTEEGLAAVVANLRRGDIVADRTLVDEPVMAAIMHGQISSSSNYPDRGLLAWRPDNAQAADVTKVARWRPGEEAEPETRRIESLDNPLLPHAFVDLSVGAGLHWLSRTGPQVATHQMTPVSIGAHPVCRPNE